MAGLVSFRVAKNWRFLSSMAEKFKRKVQRYFCLENPAGWGSLREAKSLFIDCLSGRASKFKKKNKTLFMVCTSGRAGKFEKRGKKCRLFIYIAEQGS